MSVQSVAARLAPAAQYYIEQVKRKMATGIYQTEPVACFCGSTTAMPVTDTDRYGFNHPMWLCKQCGIIYANPRMTEASYAEFYATEYRHIYDHDGDTGDDQHRRGLIAAADLRDYLAEHYTFCPKVVFDIGCNAGSWLQPFLDVGATVHGVDYGPERIASGRTHGLPIDVGSMEALEVLGLQADLILMNHVLEHVTNLESTLGRVRALLREDGMLYVALPGLFAADLPTLFQNAHPWQFTAETLAYVMECCGFEEVRADHTITSLWRKASGTRQKTAVAHACVRDIANFLFRRGTRYLPQVRTFNKVPLPTRRLLVSSAVSRQLPEITDLIDRHPNGTAIILGGGPSADGEVETIRQLQAQGAVLLSIERMYPWCQQHGLCPEYVVAQDAHPDVIEAYRTLAPGSTHLVAAQCQPEVFDAVAGQSVYLFHTPQMGIDHAALDGPGPQGVVINSAGSVTLCSMSIAMLLGCRALHIVGFDCHTTAGGYAQGIAGVGEQKDRLRVKIDGQSFTTTLAYIAFAQQFFQLKDIGEESGLLTSVKIYGDSLVTAMSKDPIGA